MSRTEFVYGNVERNGVRNRVHHLDAQTLLELLKTTVNKVISRLYYQEVTWQ